VVEAAVVGVAAAAVVAVAAATAAAVATTEIFLLTQAYANVTRYCTPAHRSTTQTKHLTVS
jgi:hypothetical protein